MNVMGQALSRRARVQAVPEEVKQEVKEEAPRPLTAQEFVEAARDNTLSVEQLENYLNNGDDIDACALNGSNALHWASQKGHVQIVHYLLEAGADIEASGANNSTAIIFASQTADNEVVVQRLLSGGANINAVDQYGNTALICAENKGHTRIVELLLAQANININLINNTGRNALMEAQHRNRLDVAENKLSPEIDLKKVEDRIAVVKTQFFGQFSRLQAKSNFPLINNINKYNQATVVRVEMTNKSLEALLERNKQIKGLPKFIADFLELKPSQHREILALRPELITWTEDGQYLVMPNPEQTNHKLLIQDPKKAKYDASGFGLIVWHIHPDLLQKSIFHDKDKIIKEIIEKKESLRYGQYGTKENLKKSLHKVDSFSKLMVRDSDKLSIGEINKQSSIPYLSSPFEYNQDHLRSLKLLRETVKQHLFTEYGVNKSDTIDMYFHAYYSVKTTTVHLHIRVNQIHHGLELDKSISLDEVIKCLDKGGSVKELYYQRAVIHKDLHSLSFLNNDKHKTKIVPNPYCLSELTNDQLNNTFISQF